MKGFQPNTPIMHPKNTDTTNENREETILGYL